MRNRKPRRQDPEPNPKYTKLLQIHKNGISTDRYPVVTYRYLYAEAIMKNK